MTNRVGSFWLNVVSGVAKLAFFAVFFGTISFSYQTAYAENIEYSVTIEPSLNLTIPSNLITLDLHPELTTFGSQDLTVGVSTNSAYGYQLSMSSDSTSLVDIADNNKTMPTLPAKAGGYTTSEFVANKWGYKQDDGNYIPYVSGTTLLESNAPSAGDSTTLNFAAKIDYGQAAGNYNIGLKFLAVANIGDYIVSIVNNNTTSNINFTDVPSGESKTFTVTPKSGYYLSAVSCPNGYTCSGYTTGTSATDTQTITITNNDTINGGVLTLTGEPIAVETCQRFGNTTLQDFDSDKLCDNQGESGILIDNRDNQSYTVAKLGDDRWWMVDNLNLGATTLNTDLTSANTNLSNSISADTFNSWRKNDYAHIATTGAYYIALSGADPVSGTKYGMRYNYCATAAGTYCMEEADMSSSISYGNADYDICPAGWRLPTGGDSGELRTLLESGYDSPEKLRASLANNGAAFAFAGSSMVGDDNGVYWSSTEHKNGSMFTLFFTDTGSSTNVSFMRCYNNSVRCIRK